MPKKKTEKLEYPTLEDIHKVLAEVDKKRDDDQLTKEERELLELSAVALRDSERLMIAFLQKNIVEDMVASTSSINTLAKTIRTKVSDMNKASKSIDKIESVIKVVVEIIGAVAKWAA